MQIIDINGKERSVEYARVIQEKKVDILGNDAWVKYVEVLVKGKSRKWKEWYPLEGFKEQNPECILR